MSTPPPHDDWETRTVESLATVRGGKRLPKGQSLVAVPTPHPYVRVTDMYPGGVTLGEIRYVPEHVAPYIRSYRIFQDDIFISVAGTLGIVGRIPPELDGANLTENADRITSISCDVDYLMYSLLSEPIQREIAAIRTVGAQPKLALGRIKQFEIRLPKDQSEQRQIANALRDADDLVASLQRLIAKKQGMKQGISQQLLTGQTRLPGFEGAWAQTTAGSIGTFKGGNGFPLRFQGGKKGRYPFFKVSDMNGAANSRFMRQANNYISDVVRKQLGARAFPARAIVFAKVGAAVFLERKRILETESCIDNNMAAMMIDPGKADYRFIHYALEGFRMASLVATTALPSLNGTQLRSIPLHLPVDLDEQAAIASVLADADAEIDALKLRLDKAKAIKQGMAQQLLTGKTRLSALGAVA